MEAGEERECIACGRPVSGPDARLCPDCREEASSEGVSYSQVDPDETLLVGQAPDPLVGTTVGLYRIDELAGQGGMGQVYKAWHTRLERPVALKVLPRERLADPRRRRRFLREAKSASSLAHPNIVTVHDLIEEGERDFLVMEYVHGPTLAQVIPEDGLPVARALRYARQIAAGLAAAHKAGIVHRDVKPGNVMIAEGDVAKLVDFGLAKLTDETTGAEAGAFTRPTRTQLTRQGARVGTANYMSPEQALGGVVDHRSDIFSLGAVLYETLSGRRPFSGPSHVAVMNNVVYKEPRPLEKLAPGVPPELRQLISKALAKKPEDRYSTMAELEGELRALGQSTEMESSAAVLARRPRSRAPRALALGLALLAAAILLIPGSRQAVLDSARALVDRRSASGAEGELDSLDAYELYQRGESYLERYDREGYVDRAIDAFQRAIVKREDYAAAHSGLAAALRRKAFATKDPVLLEQAEQRARRALELEPELLEAEVNLALVLIDRGDLDEASSRLERVTRIDPGSAAAHRGLGDLAVARKEWDPAVEHYRRAIELEPENRELYGLLGSAHYRAARYDDAAAAYRRRVELAPDDVIGRKNLAAALHMLGDYSGAIRELQEAVKVRPEWSVYNNLGTLYFFQGLYEDAVRAFEKALEHGAQNYLVWANLGDAYRWTPGQEEKAADAYLRAVQLVRKDLDERPDDTTRESRLALFLAKRGDFEEALRHAAELAEVEHEDARVLYRLATVYELAGDRGRALGLLERAFLGGYSMTEFERDPELARLRASTAGQSMLARVEVALAVDE